MTRLVCKRCGDQIQHDNADGEDLCEACTNRNTPVAPVSPDATGKCGELVTVAWFQPSQRCCDNGWMEAMAWQEGEFSAPVVLRSQAVELLAAERAKVQHWREQYTEMHSQFIDLAKSAEADNVAKDARIKELEQELENGGRVKGVNTQYANALAYLEMNEDDDPEEFAKRIWDERETLEAKLAAAERALEAIEDHAARCFTLSTHSTTALAYLKDIQDEARAALGGKPS